MQTQLLSRIKKQSVTKYHKLVFVVFFAGCSFINLIRGQEVEAIPMEKTYPWCIVAYDSLERSPSDRIQMIKDLGFTKYAYDWRDKHLEDTQVELKLATMNQIEIVSVWLWLNAKRDGLGKLSSANKSIFKIIETLGIKTTFWLGLSPNFFNELDRDESLKLGIQIVDWVTTMAKEIDCKVALYNHSGWFADPRNQLEIIKALPQHEIGLVYNFHHAHDSISEFSQIVDLITPHLSAVNLNGMAVDGDKILEIGKGDYEKEMIEALIKSGFKGPWGIMGHVADQDAETILKKNINGLKTLKLLRP